MDARNQYTTRELPPLDLFLYIHILIHNTQQALKELITVLPQVIEAVKATCPDMTKTDAQMLGAFCVHRVRMIDMDGRGKDYGKMAPERPTDTQRL